MDLNQLIHTTDKNKLRCHHGRCLFERLRAFQRDEMVVRSRPIRRRFVKPIWIWQRSGEGPTGKSVGDPHVRSN